MLIAHFVGVRSDVQIMFFLIETLIRKTAQIYYLLFSSSNKKRFNSVNIYDFVFIKRNDFFIKLKIIRLKAKIKINLQYFQIKTLFYNIFKR